MTPNPRGRPRSFDRAAALERATRLFWQHGYDATSVADLTRAMGIGPPSLYAAFGDKKTLFEEAIEDYIARHGRVLQRTLDEAPTARDGVARMLRQAAIEYTEPGRPRGCLIIAAATSTETSEEVAAQLRAKREGNIRGFERRIRADVAAGLLPEDTDATALARFFGAVMQGMSQQARDGASREELTAVAQSALRAWPTT